MDLYRDQLARGGKPHIHSFHNLLMKGFAGVYRSHKCGGWKLTLETGPGYTEDITAMLAKRPLFDDYWDTKCIPVEDIDIPMYIAASFSYVHPAAS